MTIEELKDKLNKMTFRDEGNQMQPEACISLLSDSEPEEELMIREEVRRVPRFDCLTG